jgi:hypothetical protein
MEETDKKTIRLKAGISTIKFCMTNEMCFVEDEFIGLEGKLDKIQVPVCNIENSCKYHGQKIPDGRYICDYLLKQQNEEKIAKYLAGGKNVRKQGEI